MIILSDNWNCPHIYILEKKEIFMKKIIGFVVVTLVLASFVWAESPKNYLQNGDFESPDATGWSIQFSEWGEGEESASWSLSTKADNAPNTTQKLSLYNGMKDDVEFTITQTVSVPVGDYIGSVIFEGGPERQNSNTTLSIDGKSQPFGVLAGWQNWQQVVLENISISNNKKITIEIKGVLTSEMWMSIDDIAFVPKAEFTKKIFRSSR